jgi:hypothetical protein
MRGKRKENSKRRRVRGKGVGRKINKKLEN